MTQQTVETTLTKAPFKADHVGSFLRPERLKQARLQKENGEITSNELRAIEDEEIRILVEKQKEAGLTSVTDGEFRRAWWHLDFLAGLDGIEFHETEEGIQFNGVKTRAHGIKVTGKIGFSEHYMIEHFKFLQSIAGDAVAKFTIPSPNMLYFRGTLDTDVYSRHEDFYEDLIAAYQGVIQALYDAGCRYLQLDDTAWSIFFRIKVRSKLLPGVPILRS